MTVRSVVTFVKHVIKRHPDAETTATARCVHPDCGWEAPPTGDANECADWCMEHTGRTGHGIFLRTFSEIAVVVRADR